MIESHTHICVWDIQFYKVDEDGNEVRNEDGTVKLFTAPKLDYAYLFEYVEDDDLEEE